MAFVLEQLSFLDKCVKRWNFLNVQCAEQHAKTEKAYMYSKPTGASTPFILTIANDVQLSTGGGIPSPNVRVFLLQDGIACERCPLMERIPGRKNIRLFLALDV